MHKQNNNKYITISIFHYIFINFTIIQSTIQIIEHTQMHTKTHTRSNNIQTNELLLRLMLFTTY